jgi:hypothetical protein
MESPASPADNQRGLDRQHAQELESARRAVDRWADFPVERLPRPLVLTAPASRVEGGFRSAEAKLAFIHGLIESIVPVPDPVLAVLRARPAGAAGPPRGTTPLVIVGATRSQAGFWTDRGLRRLPAWRLEADGATGPIWVLDPELAPTPWEPGRPSSISRHRNISAVLGADGQTLTFSFVGAVPEIVEYAGADTVESDRAVAVVPLATYVGPPASFHTAVGRWREVAVRLGNPLGARVLVDLDSTPGEVTEAETTLR